MGDGVCEVAAHAGCDAGHGEEHAVLQLRVHGQVFGRLAQCGQAAGEELERERRDGIAVQGDVSENGK